MSNLVSQAQCAAALGVSRQAIHKQVGKGKLPLVDGKIDLDVARAIFAATLDPARSKILRNVHEAQQPPAGASATPPPSAPTAETPDALTNYHLAKTLRENYEARSAKLRFEQDAGTLVKADDVRAAASQLAMLIAAGLDMLPARIGALLANEPDPAKREAMVEDECRRLREDFAARAAELMALRNA